MKIQTVLLAGWIAGVLNIVTMLLLFTVIAEKTTALVYLQSISRGVLGEAAYSGGMATALLGLALHFVIAIAFSFGYGWLSSRFAMMRQHKVIFGVLFGIVTWAMLNLLVIPVFFTGLPPLTVKAIVVNLAIVIVSFSLPVALIFAKNQNR